MNTYKKFCPNVFIAQCDKEYNKGDIIIVSSKYGTENEHIVYNLIAQKNGVFFYSITRVDGFNCQERAKNKVEKLNNWASSAIKRADVWRERSNEGRDFLMLGEPIKVGHHSEKRHRALIERNFNRMQNSMNEIDKAISYKERTAYWEKMSKKINLSMPESLEFFCVQLEEATEYHKALKNGSIEREHAYSLTYANKRVKDLQKSFDIAKLLWS
jgi:hypothetical protein